MASNQFNNWEPVLDAVNGRMQQEPRVFAHDAASVTTGAVNTTWGDGGFSISDGGTGFVPGDVGATLTATTGTPALTATIDSVDSGAVTGITITNVGGAYTAGSTLAFTGGTGAGFEITISNIDIPNTQKRGCCLYVGVAGDYGVMLESGNTVTFKGVAAGSFLPVLAKQVTSGIATVGDVLALY